VSLKQYDWPGNVVELQKVIECAMILAKSEGMRLDLALALSRPAEISSHEIRRRCVKIYQQKDPRGEDLRHLERDRILAASQRSNRNISGLGGPPSSRAST
jgi:transcriptional regulator with PAS, ATPase and Fis domain